MTSAIPPTPATPPAPAPAPAPTVSVAEPPAALLRLPPGSQVAAVIAEANAGGEISLQTAYGLLRAASRLPLPPRTELLLQVRTPSTPLQLQILTVDGRLPAAAPRTAPAPTATPSATPYAAPPAPSTTPAVPPTPGQPLPTAQPAAPVQLATGTTLTATVLRPPAIAGAFPAATPSPSPGHSFTNQAPSPSAPTTAPPTGPTAAPTAVAAVAATAATATTKSPILAAGTRLTLRIAPQATPSPQTAAAGTTATPGNTSMRSPTLPQQTTIAQPSATQPAATSSPAAPGTAGASLAAVVTGSTRAGQPIVQTPLGLLVLETRAPMATGTTVNLTITEPPSPPPPPSLSGFSHLLGVTGGDPRTWPTMEEALKALAVADPQSAQQVARAVLPQPDSRLAAMLLNFIAALRGGDLSGWLGDGPNRLLQRVKPGLAGALGEEFRQASRLANEPTSGDWRLLVLPFADDQQIQPIRLMIRQRSGDSQGEGDGAADREGTRFVFDIDTTRLGRMQLDGLVRNRNKRFDLIIRTASPMPVEMRTDIRHIFADANAITGIVGSVGFQSDPPGFVDLPPEAFVDDPLGLTV